MLRHFYIFLLRLAVIMSPLWLPTVTPAPARAQLTAPIIADHTRCDITQLPEAAIVLAKNNLHIAYGHTSHGSQIVDGMSGLVAFANSGGKGLSLPADIFAWNNGGTGGALDLHDQFVDGDVGYWPDWYNDTRAYLNNSANSDVNVVIWSWCGQVHEKWEAGTLDSEYLTPMTQLENDYPGVTFVYMTGHVNHYYDYETDMANQAIRDYCTANNKVLFDFADIESYNPDGVFYEYPNDNCDYYDQAENGTVLGNWAIEWQTSHTEGVDWYNCTSAHSEPLNANLKAYAAWWLWARIAGWDGSAAVQIDNFSGRIGPDGVELSWQITTDENLRGFNIYRRAPGAGAPALLNTGGPLPISARSYLDSGVRGGESYGYILCVVREDGSEFRSTELSVRVGGLITALHQNYPNPFNPVTVIDYQLNEPSRVVLRVYNPSGQAVRTLVSGNKSGGPHSVIWDGRDDRGMLVGSGVYFYRLRAGKFSQVRQMVLLR